MLKQKDFRLEARGDHESSSHFFGTATKPRFLWP
jgi:hypothetical protein